MTKATIMAMASAFHPKKKGWVATAMLINIDEEVVGAHPSAHRHMEEMDGWVFDINSILHEYKLVDIETYGVYDEQTKTFRLVEASLFNDMKEL